MIFLAIRQLLSRPWQTLLALGGITLGAAAFLVISGIMLGFRQLFINQLINATAHVSISAEAEDITDHSLDSAFFPGSLVSWVVPPVARDESPHLENPQGWYDLLDSDSDVLAYSPQYTAQVLLARTKLSRPTRLIGVEAAKQVAATDIVSDMKEGDFMDLGRGGFQIALGTGLAQKLGVRRLDTITVLDSRGQAYPAKVAGFFQTGVVDIDDTTAYGPLYFVQQVGQAPGEISQISVRLKNPDNAHAAADRWSRFGNEKVQSWDQANASFMGVFKMQDMVRFIVCFVILTVAAFGIYNILNNMVNQKRGEIAILRSMGYSSGEIVRLFLFQGILLGTIGGVAGLIIGTLGCLYLQTIQIGSVGVVTVDHMLIAWKPVNYLISFSMALTSGVVAGYFPARAAGKMSPIDILRAEG